jgi:two-component system chemotaxis response regulator CheB
MAAQPRDVVVIGGSAGAVEGLFQILGQLPPDPEVAMAVTLHRQPNLASSMGHLFGRRSLVTVVEPTGDEPFVPGVIYLAPPDRHMTVHGRRIRVDRGPKQHHTRPAIDPLFRSAAETYGRRVIGVLLSGNLSDGVGGLIEIKQRGGISLVQDPQQAPFPSMPTNALIYDNVDLIFQIQSLWPLLAQLARGDSVAHLLGALQEARPELIPPFWPARSPRQS